MKSGLRRSIIRKWEEESVGGDNVKEADKEEKRR